MSAGKIFTDGKKENKRKCITRFDTVYTVYMTDMLYTVISSNHLNPKLCSLWLLLILLTLSAYSMALIDQLWDEPPWHSGEDIEKRCHQATQHAGKRHIARSTFYSKTTEEKKRVKCGYVYRCRSHFLHCCCCCTVAPPSILDSVVHLWYTADREFSDLHSHGREDRLD